MRAAPLIAMAAPAGRGNLELRSGAPVRRGARGIELMGRQTIDGRPHDVRSSHVIPDGTEIVVARPGDCAGAYPPLPRSLRIR